jgi:hypothetical protein
MLPIGLPPNAIASAARTVFLPQMVYLGLWMALISTLMLARVAQR